MEVKRTWNWPVHLGTLVFGSALAVSLASLLFYPELTGMMRSLAGAILWFVGLVLAFLLINKVIYPKLLKYPPKTRGVWICLCLLAGFILVYAIPFNSYPKQNQLRIVATGERDPAAHGSEVWLEGIASASRDFSAIAEKVCDGSWQFTAGKLVSVSNQPAELICRIPSDEQINVRFGAHPWSGEVRVDFAGERVERNLYSPGNETVDVVFRVKLSKTEQTFKVLIIIANGISLAGLLLASGLWLVNLPNLSPFPRKRKLTPWIGYSIPMIVGWLIYYLAYWPGFLSPDVVDQLSQVGDGRLNNWHPAFHTLTLWAITRIWFSPSAVALLQIVILSCLLGWGLGYFERQATPGWSIWLTAFFLGLSPAIALNIISLWKDVAFSIILVGLTLLLLQIVNSAGEWLEKRAHWLLLGSIAALAALYRLNGALVVFGSLVVLPLVFRRHRKPALFALLLGLGLWLLAIGPVYRMLGVITTNTRPEALGSNLGLSGAAFGMVQNQVLAGTQLTPEEQSLYDAVAPGGKLGAWLTLSDNSAALNRLAFQLALRNPAAALDFLSKKSSFIFQIIQPPEVRTEFVSRVMIENPFGIQAASKLPWAQSVLEWVASRSESPALSWLVWRNAFWMFLLLLGVTVASKRSRNSKYFIVILPVLLNALPLALFSGGHLARYILPTLLLGPFLTGYFLTFRSVEPLIPGKPDMASIE